MICILCGSAGAKTKHNISVCEKCTPRAATMFKWPVPSTPTIIVEEVREPVIIDEPIDPREAQRLDDIEIANDQAIERQAADEEMVAKTIAEPVPNIPVGLAENLNPPPFDNTEPNLKLVGLDAVMTLQEYKDKMNRAYTDTPTLTKEYGELLFSVGPIKPIVEMDINEVSEHIRFLENFITNIKIVKQRSVIHKETLLGAATESVREATRKKDREYKVKAQEAKADKPKVRAEGKSKEEKAIESLMKNLNMSREQAIAFVKKQGA